MRDAKEMFEAVNYNCGLYKLIFRDGTTDYYELERGITDSDDVSNSGRIYYYWTKKFPLSETPRFSNDDDLAALVEKIEVLFGDDEVTEEEIKNFREYETYRRNYYEYVSRNQLLGINPKCHAFDLSEQEIEAFNEWLSSPTAQGLVSTWCDAELGYTDIECEDTTMLLLGAFKAGMYATIKPLQLPISQSGNT